MIKYLLDNYAQSKALEPLIDLVSVLDFYEFEDEELRTHLISSVKEFQYLKQYDFQKFNEYWDRLKLHDCALWDSL